MHALGFHCRTLNAAVPFLYSLLPSAGELLASAALPFQFQLLAAAVALASGSLPKPGVPNKEPQILQSLLRP